MSFRVKPPPKKKNEVFHVDADTLAANAAAAALESESDPGSSSNADSDSDSNVDSDLESAPSSKKGKKASTPKKKKQVKDKKPSLTLNLQHGESVPSSNSCTSSSPRADSILDWSCDAYSFVIMEGELLQSKWEHAVFPKGFRIAATARRIMEGHGKKKPAAKTPKVKPEPKPKVTPKPRSKRKRVVVDSDEDGAGEE